MAVYEGGGNPASNSKLAALIAKAKANSVPNDNIQRIIKRAEGGDKTEYQGNHLWLRPRRHRRSSSRP